MSTFVDPTRWRMSTSAHRQPSHAFDKLSTPIELAITTAHKDGRQHMLTITEKIPAASTRRPAIGTVRLRLKPAHRSCGFVQGAWWPRATDLGSELPALLAALSLRAGPIDSVLYHENDWSPAPLSIKHQGDHVIVSAHQEWPNVISLFGPRFGKLDLLVVPPYTEATHAYNIVTTAASVNDASTPEQLLGTHATAMIDCSPPPRSGDGKPREVHYHTHHAQNLRSKTPKHAT
jgi:hypothetical protein